VQVVAHSQPTTPFQIGPKTASDFLLPAGAYDGVAIALLAKFKFDETSPTPAGSPFRSRGGGDSRKRLRMRRTMANQWSKRIVTFTGRSEHVSVETVRRESAIPTCRVRRSNRVLRAQRRALRRIQIQESAMTSTVSAGPSARMLARSTTVCSLTCWASASAARDSSGGLVERDRTCSIAHGERWVARRSRDHAASNTGLRLVPAASYPPRTRHPSRR